MSNLIPTVKRNGSDRNSKLGFRTLPSISSWMDDIINENFGNEFLSNFNTGITLPAVNVLDNDNEYVVEMAIPGMKKSDFNINVENDVLSISAESNIEEEETKDEKALEDYKDNPYKDNPY